MTYVVLVLPLLCQPLGEANKSAGSVATEKPCVKISFSIVKTWYYRFCVQRQIKTSIGAMITYRCTRNKVRDGCELSAVRIDEGLIPGSGIFVSDLDYTSEDGTTIILGEVFQGCWELIVLAVQSLLSGCYGLIEGNGRGGGSNRFYKYRTTIRCRRRRERITWQRTWFNERRAEGDDLFMDIIQQLLLRRLISHTIPCCFC